MSERTTVRLEAELLRQAKLAAAEQGRTLTSLLEEGLRTVLDSHKSPARTCGYPRNSSATGGTRHGIDLSSNASIAAALDGEVPFEKLR